MRPRRSRLAHHVAVERAIPGGLCPASHPARPPLKDALAAGGLRVTFAVAPLLPRRVALVLADLVGDFLWAASPRRKALARNLRVVLDGDEAAVRAACRASFRTQARNYADLLQLHSWSGERILGLVELEGRDELDAALAEGRGAVLTFGHLGNLDVIAHALATLGYQLIGVVEPLKSPKLMALLERVRDRPGLELVPSDEAGWALVRGAREGRILVVVADWDPSGGGRPETFFGRTVRFPDSYAHLAVRGVPLMFGESTHLPDGRYRARLRRVPVRARGLEVAGDTPVAPTATPRLTSDERDAAVAAVVADVLALLEAQVRRAPGQWLVFRDVF